MDFEIAGQPVGEMFDFGGDGSVDAVSPFPLNFMCLCFSLVVFGATGLFAAGYMTSVWMIIGLLVAIVLISAAAYYLLYKFIVQPLKKSNPRAIDRWDVFAAKGKLTLRIVSGSPGVVSLKDSTGAAISYRADAKPDVLLNWDGEIPQGTEVQVVDIDAVNKLVYVRPLDTFDNHKLRKYKEI